MCSSIVGGVPGSILMPLKRFGSAVQRIVASVVHEHDVSHASVENVTF
jgi:hypothetical protein